MKDMKSGLTSSNFIKVSNTIHIFHFAPLKNVFIALISYNAVFKKFLAADEFKTFLSSNRKNTKNSVLVVSIKSNLS